MCYFFSGWESCKQNAVCVFVVSLAGRSTTYADSCVGVREYPHIVTVPSRSFLLFLGFKLPWLPLDIHGSVHYNTNRIEITNKMRPCSRIYYSNVS